VYETPLPLGDVAIFAINPMAYTKSALRPVLNSLKITIAKLDGYKDDVEFGKVDPIALSEISTLAENISKGCAAVESDSKIVAEIEKVGKDLETACKEASKKGGEDKEKQKVVAENSPLASTAAKMAVNLMTKLQSDLKSWELTTAKGVLDYCSASLSQVEA
jgi:hypothetical protein